MMRALGGLGIALLVAAVLLWGLLVGGLASLGREDPAGRGLASAYLLAWTALLWIVLGLLLWLGARSGAGPAWTGPLALVLHPVSGVVAVWVVAMIVDRGPAWLMVIPAGAAFLIAGAAIWYLVPGVQAGTGPGGLAALWGGVAVLCLAVVPARARSEREAAGRRAAVQQAAREDSVAEAARRRAGLEQRLAALAPDAPLEAWLDLAWPPNDVSRDALARARTLPRRQADAEAMVAAGLTLPLRFGDELALEPTPALCRGAVALLVRNARDLVPADPALRLPFESAASRIEFYRPALEWVARRCDGAAAVAAFEAAAGAFVDSPERARYLAWLQGLRTR